MYHYWFQFDRGVWDAYGWDEGQALLSVCKEMREFGIDLGRVLRVEYDIPQLSALTH